LEITPLKSFLLDAKTTNILCVGELGSYRSWGSKVVLDPNVYGVP
jgi:hypothetical protein